MRQQWSMQAADDADCKLGHFYSSRGDYYFHSVFLLIMKDEDFGTILWVFFFSFLLWSLGGFLSSGKHVLALYCHSRKLAPWYLCWQASDPRGSGCDGGGTGEMYDVVKQEMDSTKLFAIFPNAATQFSGFSLFLFIWETSVYLHDVCFNQEVLFVI